MKIRFHKYQGAGNDFILIDNRDKLISPKQNTLFAQLCKRRFSIGADGLILLQAGSTHADFEMIYANSDGAIASFCGNGGRCIVAFAGHLGIIKNHTTTFMAADSTHQATLNDGLVSLQMQDVARITAEKDGFLLDTGSPHYVQWVSDLFGLDVLTQGKAIRNSYPNGVNVNFVQKIAGNIHIRTYERGVENETLACGTGAVAVALALAHQNKVSAGSHTYKIATQGGDLQVRFEIADGQNTPRYQNIWLIGAATFVFEGCIEVGG